MYRIPQDIRYKEKIAGVTVKQFIYLCSFGFISYAIYTSGMIPLIKKPLLMLCIGLGLSMAFLNFDRVLLWALRFAEAYLKIYRINDIVRDFFGIKEVKNSAIALVDNSLVAVIEVGSLDFNLISDVYKEEATGEYMGFLNSLDFPVQLISRSSEIDTTPYFRYLRELNPHEGKIDSFSRFLTGYMRKKRVMGRKSYVVIPMRNDRPMVDLSDLSVKRQNKADFSELEKRVNSVMERLEKLNLNPRLLRNREIIKLLASYFDSPGEKSTSKLIRPSGRGIGYDAIKFNEMYHQVVYAAGYPNMVSAGCLKQLVMMAGDFDISIHINPVSAHESIRKLNREVRKQQTDIVAMERKGQFIPVSLQLQNRDTKDLLMEVQSGSERLFEVSFYVNTRAHTRKGLRQLTGDVCATLRGMMIEPSISVLRVVDGVKSTLPIARDALKETRTMTSSSLSAFFPFLFPDTRIGKDSVFIGFNDDTNTPLFLDTSELMNGSGVVLGASGSGKGYTLKPYIGKNLLYPDRSVAILDKEGEYDNLIQLYCGEIIKISPNSGTSLNPFDLFGMALPDKLLSLQSFMQTVLGEITEAQQAMLDEALRRIYEIKGFTDDPNTWRNEPPIFRDLYDFISGKEHDRDKDVKRTAGALSRKLKVYTHGSMSFMNSHTNVDTKKKLISFNIREVPERAVQPVMYMILEFLIHRVNENLEKMTIVIDEGWSVLESNAGKRIFEMARTSRKRNCDIIIATQLVGDFLRRKPDGTIPGQAILGNVGWVVLLWQNSSVINDVAKTFNLNAKEIRRLSSSEGISRSGQGKGILIVENRRIPLRIVASPEEHRIITTKPDELMEIRRNEHIKPKETGLPIYSTDRKVIAVSELDEKHSEQHIKDLIKQGYEIIRDPALGKGRGSKHLIKNDTQEGNDHFILAELIYWEVKKYTDRVERYTSAKPDITFLASDNRSVIAIEAETGSSLKFNKKEFKNKLDILKRDYDSFFFVLTNARLKKEYGKYGRTLTRTEVAGEIKKYFSA